MTVFFNDPVGTEKGYKEWVESSDFTGVRLTRLAPHDFPESVLDALCPDKGDVNARGEIKNTLFYFQVETDQGNFGIVHASPPFVDLTQSGVKVDGNELVAVFAESLLLRLWAALVKKKMADEKAAEGTE